MSTTLKPCPFCASIELSITFTDLTARVNCQRCGANGPENKKQTMEQAEAAWNDRSQVMSAH
ncbi:MAG: hypothetical protein HOM11_07305 [Methylococcales bacterium]|jgi:hypothetical protein|nr:hypothetical protein [Methylococcales bacterium]MBT7445281.1 hypothetical protein [Methylococcales bacterium]